MAVFFLNGIDVERRTTIPASFELEDLLRKVSRHPVWYRRREAAFPQISSKWPNGPGKSMVTLCVLRVMGKGFWMKFQRAASFQIGVLGFVYQFVAKENVEKWWFLDRERERWVFARCGKRWLSKRDGKVVKN